MEKIYGLFINQKFIKDGTYDELQKYITQFEFDVRAKYGQMNVESLVVELEDLEYEANGKVLRVETDDEIIFYDIGLYEKNI